MKAHVLQAKLAATRSLGLSLALAALLTASDTGASELPPPNLLLLVAEDLSSRIGAFGDPVAVTPNLDALAAEGVRYPNTFTSAGVCAPSRAALITGVHQISIGGQHMRTLSRPEGRYTAVPPPDVKAFPELLRAAGYFTFVTEKLDYQFSDSPFPGSGPFTIWDEEFGGVFGFDGDADVPAWRGRSPGQPFFGMMNFDVTHESGVFRPLGTWPHSVMHFVMQLVRARAYGLSPEPGPVLPEDVLLPPYYPDTPLVREDLARFYNNIHTMDRQVGELLVQLEADGLADSTVVIWTTDHGDGLPRAKRELYDSGLQVPMIIRWPEAYRPADVQPGDVDARLVSFVDLAPTLLSLAGAEVPGFVHGRKLAVLGGEPRQYVYASRDRIDEVPDRQRAIRDGRFKLIRSYQPEQPGGHRLGFRDNQEIMRELWRLKQAGELDAAQRLWFEPPGEERLFDLHADPFELDDVSDSPAYAADLARMRAALDAWLERIEDWSEVPESELVARFWPDGQQPVTATPELRIEAGQLQLRAVSPGSSLGYRIDDGAWQLYTGPFALPEGATATAKAVRYGWAESEERSIGGNIPADSRSPSPRH